MLPIRPQLIVVAITAISTMALVPVLVSSIGTNEVTIGIARVIIACAVLTPLLIRRQYFKKLKAREWLIMLAIGVVFGIHWLTYFYAIKHTTPSLGALSLSTYGIHMLWINALIQSKRPSQSDTLAIALCFVGCIIVTPSLDLANDVTFGFAVGVFSGLLYACLPFMHQRIAYLPTALRSWAQFGFAGLFFMLFWPQTHWQLDSADWSRLLALGVVCTLVAHTLWVKATTELPAVVASACHYLYIPIAMALSYYFMNEAITTNKVVGAILIVGACLLGILLPALRRR